MTEAHGVLGSTPSGPISKEMKNQVISGRPFTKESKTKEILKEAISAIPPKTKVYVVGGAARNLIYYDLFKKSLPQRDYDLLFIGNLGSFVKRLRKIGFTYGRIRRKHEVVMKKKLSSNPKINEDYIYLDIHLSKEPSVLENLKENSAFTINGFAILFSQYFSKKVKKHLIAIPNALSDLRNRRLRLNIRGYKKHAGNLFACLRFMSIGFEPPTKEEIMLLLEELPKLEKWRFGRNVKKVFDYVGGEKKAQQLVKSLGIKRDVFSIEKLRNSKAKNNQKHL